MNPGFIGIGKIATAVIEGLMSSSLEDLKVRLSPRNEENSIRLASAHSNIMRMGSNQEVLDQSDIVFLALRPPHAKDVLTELNFRENHTVISLIPLISYSDIAILVHPASHICRAIPLPPVVNHNCPIPVYNPTEEILNILNRIGQPLLIADEEQLHAIWTLTCLITPYYDLLNELSIWTINHGVDQKIANQYIANLFQSLSYTAQISDPIDFADLARHAATPNGMNDQAGREIRASGAHDAFLQAAERILTRFPEKR